MLKLFEIVILWVYYTIPFGFSLFWHVWDISFQHLIILFWLRITDEGSVPEMRIWSILLIQSDLKWCIHLSRSLFLYLECFNTKLFLRELILLVVPIFNRETGMQSDTSLRLPVTLWYLEMWQLLRFWKRLYEVLAYSNVNSLWDHLFWQLDCTIYYGAADPSDINPRSSPGCLQCKLILNYNSNLDSIPI